MTKCPGCGDDIHEAATFCWTCREYVSVLGRSERCVAGTVASRIPDDRLEDVIQEAGRKALELLGFTVYSISQPRATMQTPGIADTYVAGHGRTTWAEWKRPGKKQSPDQLLFEEVVTANGAEYHVWTHEDEAIAWARTAMATA